MGEKITNAVIQCQLCRARFSPPIEITNRNALEDFVAWGGIVDCPECHHFVEIGRWTVK
jgi:hypothetical protein